MTVTHCYAQPCSVVFYVFHAGLRSWEIDLTVCDLNYELQLFKDKHSAQFSSEVKGQSYMRCKIFWR